MDFLNEFKVGPLPIEKEFQIQSVKHRIHELSREELETFLIEALSTMTKLAHQVTEMRNFLEYVGGKNEKL